MNHPRWTTLDDLAALVPDGARLGIGGFHFSRLPIALLQAVVRRGVRDLDYISWGGGLGLELLLEARAVRKLTLCFTSLDVFGLAPRFRAAIESGEVELEEWTALGMIQGSLAAQMQLPSLPMQVPEGSDLVARSGFATIGPDPITGRQVASVRALPLDVFLLHAHRADDDGNVEIQGARGLDFSSMFAARHVLVTVEERVPNGTLQRSGARGAFVLPRTFVTAIAEAPWGAYPTSCLPFYPTDYRALQEVTAAADLAIPTPSPERKAFLRAVATIDPALVTGEALASHRVGGAEDLAAAVSVDETMVDWIARQLDETSVCSVGSVSPLATVAYFLAKRTHAPGLVIMTANGGLVDVASRPMTMMLAEPLDFQTAAMHCGGDDTYHWYYQRGLISHEIVSAAQIDRRGRTNNIEVRSPSGKRIRLPGQGGMADVANMHQHFMLYLARHSALSLVDEVDIVSAARGVLSESDRVALGYRPGHVRLITNLCAFGLVPERGEWVVNSIHPGVDRDTVREQTGWAPAFSDPLPVTATPNAATVQAIRRDVDPLGMRRLEFVAGKERGPLLAALIDSEERAAAALLGIDPGVKCEPIVEGERLWRRFISRA